MKLITQLFQRRVTSMKGRITLSFFTAMLAMLMITLGIQLNNARNSRLALHESLITDLQTTWRTAINANGVNASRRSTTLMSLARHGLEENPENRLIDAETRTLYYRIDVMAPDGRLLYSSHQSRPTTPLADPGFIMTRLRYDRAFSALIMADVDQNRQPAILVALHPQRDNYLMAIRPLSAVAPLLRDGIAARWMIRGVDDRLLGGELPPDIARALLALPAGKQGVADLSVGDRVHELVTITLNDYQMQPIATLTSVRDVTDARRQARYEFIITLSAGLGLILLTTLLLYARLDMQFRPLTVLSQCVKQVADGQLYGSTHVPGATSELQQMADAIAVLQANAIESDRQRFDARVRQTANLALIEDEMNRLGKTLGSDAQRLLEAPLAAEAEGSARLGGAFRIMVDQVISQHDRLSDALAQRERDLTVVRQALAERNQLTRLREELDIARRLQIENLPGEAAMHALPDQVELHAAMRPAREVGGDFYDFALLDSRYLMLVIGDASGKGVSAAMFGMMARILLKATAAANADPGECLAVANRALASENNALLFATAFLAILDCDTGEMRYASAGHNPPLIRHRSGQLQALDQACGLVLGAMEDSHYPTHVCSLVPGDLLLLFTDGVTEAHDANHELFGDARLSAWLSQTPQADARQITDLLLAAIDQYSGSTPQFDDISVTTVLYRKDG